MRLKGVLLAIAYAHYVKTHSKLGWELYECTISLIAEKVATKQRHISWDYMGFLKIILSEEVSVSFESSEIVLGKSNRPEGRRRLRSTIYLLHRLAELL